MTTTASQTWKDLARDEHLLDGINDQNLDLLERVLTLLPDDPARVVFLRYASEHGISASSPHMTSILLMLAFMARMMASELERVNASSRENLAETGAIVGRIEAATQQVGEAAIQVLERTSHLRGHSDIVAQKMDAIANSLPERFNEVVKSFQNLLNEAAKNTVDAAQAEAFKTTVEPKMREVLAGLEVIDGDLKLLAEKMVPVAVQARDILAAEPLIIGKFKLNRVTARLATTALIVGMLLAGPLFFFVGYSISKPSAVTITPAMVRTFDQGAAYAKIWNTLTPKQQAAIKAELALPPATAPSP